MSERPTVAAYGGGTNSTALLIEAANRGIRVDAILFGDTGGELPRTYEFVALFSDWLVARGMPPITVVRHTLRDGSVETLEEECLRTKRLPSIAYGSSRRCSGKYKLEPQDKWTNHWSLAKEAWKKRERVIKLLGYDADEGHRRDQSDAWSDPRFYELYLGGLSVTQIAKQFARSDPQDEKKYKSEIQSLQRKIRASVRYEKRYLLIDWDMNRDACIATIQRAGLRLPGKSACFFCSSSKVEEILALEPVYQIRSLRIESNAMDGLTSVRGLGRSFAWADVVENRQQELPFVPPPACRACTDDSEAA